MLAPWWATGWCPAALLWALDHHPDHPTHHRGDALRGARDPLRVLGHRLTPWQGRHHELPPGLTGIRGNYTHTTTPAKPTTNPSTTTATPAQPTPSTEARAQAQAFITAHLLARGVRPRPPRRTPHHTHHRRT
jgi:hypothetical protein